MAQKRIEAQDLINPKALQSIIDDAKKLEAELTKILETNKALIKNNPFKTGADVKKLNEAAQITKKTQEALSTVRKKRIREEQQLKELRTKEAQDLAQVNALKKEQALINRQEAQANTKALGAYKNLSAQLNILRKRYKDVAVSQGINSKAAQDLAAEVNKLDSQVKEVDGSVGQFGRNVGNYKDQVEQAIKASGGFGSGLLGIVSGLKSATAASLSFLATPLGAVIGAIGVALAGVVGTFKLFTESLQSSEKGQTALNKIMSVFTGVLNGVLAVVEPLAFQLVDGIAKGLDFITAAAGSASSALQSAFSFFGFEGAAKKLDRFTNAIAKTTDKSKELAEAETELNKILREQEKTQLLFQKRAEELRQIRDDEALNIQQRIDANQELGKVLNEQTNQELILAQRSLEIAQLRARVEGESTENLDLIAEAETKILEIEERITGQRSEQLVNLNSLKKEQRELLAIQQEAEDAIISDTLDEYREKVQDTVDDFKDLEIAPISDGLLGTEEEITEEADLLVSEYDRIKKKQEELIASTQKAAELATKSFATINDQLTLRDDKIRQSLEMDAEATKENIQTQQRLAERGLSNTLAFEEEKAARLEAKREELARKAERRQKALAYLTAFTEYLKQDPNSAAGKALAQVALAETISGAFYEGTENVEQDLGNPIFKGRDGYVIRVDGKERVLNPSQNAKIGGLTNDQLADLAYAYNSGKTVSKNGSALSESGLKRIENAVKSIEISVDAEGFITRNEYEKGMRKLTRTKPRRPRI